MFFPVHIKMIRETFALHRMLPEHYPEFYNTFLVIAEVHESRFTDVRQDSRTPSTSSRIIYSLADHGLVK